MDREPEAASHTEAQQAARPSVLRRVRQRLTYSNVMATLAGFFSLGGGAYAVSNLPPKSVGKKQLKTGAVDSRVVRDHSLRARDLHPGAVDLTARQQTLSNTVALTSSPATVATTKLKATHKSNLLSFGNLTLEGGKGGGVVSYQVLVDGKPQGPVFTEDLRAGQRAVVPISLLSSTVGAGSHTVQLQCQVVSGHASVMARDFGVIAGCRPGPCV